MKTPKQLLPWGKDSLLEQVIQSARDSDLDTIYLVLGAESDRIKQQADLNNVVILENKEWEKGLGTSIATGIAALSKKEDIHGCVILLADQPFITDEYIDAMIQAFDPETIIASDYNGRAGVPCLFPKMYFPDLKKTSRRSRGWQIIGRAERPGTNPRQTG